MHLCSGVARWLTPNTTLAHTYHAQFGRCASKDVVRIGKHQDWGAQRCGLGTGACLTATNTTVPVFAPCGLRGCKNRPAPFPGRMSYKATKPGLALSVIYLSMLYIVLLFIRVPLYVLLVFVAMCSVFWLLYLSCHYLLNDWLERPL